MIAIRLSELIQQYKCEAEQITATIAAHQCGERRLDQAELGVLRRRAIEARSNLQQLCELIESMQKQRSHVVN